MILLDHSGSRRIVLEEKFRCGHCKTTKPADQFSPSQRQTGKWCRECMRADYRSKVPASPPKPCESCGAEIVEPIPKQRFCSTKCKNAEKIRLDSERRAAIRSTRVCEHCGASIAHMMASARWCGTACAMRGTRDATVRRKYRLAAKYGLTPAAFDELLASQGGRCVICGTDAPRGHGWAVDHCHNTLIVRGVLCSPCNTGIGQFKDDPARLRAAAEYLERSSAAAT